MHMKHRKFEKASSPPLLIEQIEQHRRGERAGEIIALNQIDVPFFQQLDLFFGLYAFGDDVIAHPLEGGDDALIKQRGARVGVDVIEQRAVELDGRKRQVRDGVQVGEARAEIVKAQTDIGLAEGVDGAAEELLDLPVVQKASHRVGVGLHDAGGAVGRGQAVEVFDIGHHIAAGAHAFGVGNAAEDDGEYAGGVRAAPLEQGANAGEVFVVFLQGLGEDQKALAGQAEDGGAADGLKLLCDMLEHCVAALHYPLDLDQAAKLLDIYYRRVERDCDMIYLATNFGTVFDPSMTYSTDAAYVKTVNRTGIRDKKLYQLAVDMRKTEPGDVLSYCQKWVAFQERWTEVLPAIPVYSNMYFDFYTTRLQNYRVTEN